MAKKSSSVVLMILALVALWATSSKAQPGVFVNLAVVSGIVNCSLNASTPAPPFPNANVELQCNGTTVATTVTSSSGTFLIRITPPLLLRILRDLIIGNCKIVVTTPLAKCNATLPSTGTLVAPVVSTGVGFIGSLLAFLFGILEFIFVP